MNRNPFYEFFKRYIPKILFIWIVFIVLDVIIPCIAGIQTIIHDNSNIVFVNRTSDLWYLMSFVATILFINKIFPKMLDIRGDRKAVIKAFFKISLILTIICITSGLASEFIMELICKLYGITPEFYTRISTVEWLGEGMDNLFVILLIRLINSFFIISMGYILGSLFYRLKYKYNILVFLIIPGVFLFLATYVSFFTQYLDDVVVYKLWDLGMALYNKPVICIILEVLLTGLFILIGNKFLNKAPTSEYAHDII